MISVVSAKHRKEKPLCLVVRPRKVVPEKKTEEFGEAFSKESLQLEENTSYRRVFECTNDFLRC
jgi:hypothetical protein